MPAECSPRKELRLRKTLVAGGGQENYIVEYESDKPIERKDGQELVL